MFKNSENASDTKFWNMVVPFHLYLQNYRELEHKFWFIQKLSNNSWSRYVQYNAKSFSSHEWIARTISLFLVLYRLTNQIQDWSGSFWPYILKRRKYWNYIPSLKSLAGVQMYVQKFWSWLKHTIVGENTSSQFSHAKKNSRTLINTIQ